MAQYMVLTILQYNVHSSENKRIHPYVSCLRANCHQILHWIVS